MAQNLMQMIIICVEPPHGLNVYQVSAQSDVNCRRSYTETKKFTDGRTDRRTNGRTDGRTDAEGYNIIRPFFKRAYKNGTKFNADDYNLMQII